ncbi:hypothetical protein QBC47DRAFT_423782 [Echria macrotheca]|uniref:Rhodopsin domain-containing protein n=1 Tax=Echria macrotheca TaxID=438768 RepID=A0AAJ0B947_9PEZI|nr:hypothetical protein QBC47DRAFT_423782 [Echria macrotheca]
MEGSILSEPAHPRFNLSGPPLPFNGAAAALADDSSTDAGDANIPGILFGILVPHIVCTLVILARAWSRVFLLRKWFLDDSLIMLAWAFSTTVCIVYSIAAQSPRPDGHFNTLTTSPTEDFDTPAALRTYLGLIFYQLCLCLTKLSILAFYLRIFSSRPLERRLAWATVIAVLLYGIPLLFMSVFQCHPVAGQFFGSPMKCFVFEPLLIASASLHTATDAWLIVLIIPCVVRLDLPSRQKAALAVVLSLSIFVIAASLTRLQLSLRAAGKHGEGDGVRVANTLAFFVMTVLELDMALICASAPTLRLVLARLWPRLGMGDPSMEGVIGRGARQGPSSPNGSVDLTSVVSYHGYPWTQPATPARSKNPSMNNLASSGGQQQGMPPVPPLAMLANRTPTTLSLRSFMSSMAPRSRGQTLTGGGKDGDREGLLGDGEPVRRRSSAGFDAYYDEYLPGYNGEEKRRSRTLGGMNSRRSSRRFSGRYSGRWGDSQESFVLGMNDPNSPTRPKRLSPSRGGAAPRAE